MLSSDHSKRVDVRKRLRDLMKVMAERVGFEPTKGSHPCRFSRPVHSTALPPLRVQRVYEDADLLSTTLSGEICVVSMFLRYVAPGNSKDHRLIRFSGHTLQLENRLIMLVSIPAPMKNCFDPF